MLNENATNYNNIHENENGNGNGNENENNSVKLNFDKSVNTSVNLSNINHKLANRSMNETMSEEKSIEKDITSKPSTFRRADNSVSEYSLKEYSVKTNEEELTKKIKEQREYINKFKEWKNLYKTKLNEAYN